MKRPARAIEQNPAATRGDVACYLLLHGGAERPELAKNLKCSKASITHHSRWMIEQGLMTGEPQRRPHSKRPVDWLELNPDALTALPMQLLEDRVIGECVGLDGTPLETYEQPLEGPEQKDVLRAIEQLFNRALQFAKSKRRDISMLGLSLRGVMNPWASMVNSVDGIPNWETCQPMMIISSMRGNDSKTRPVTICPQQTARLRGLAQQLQQDDRICYVSRTAGRFRIASLSKGCIAYGGTGAEQQCMHRTVADSGPACHCGRVGCLLQLLQRGEDQPELFARYILKILKKHINPTTVGFEWDGDLKPVAGTLEKAGMRVVVPADYQHPGTVGIRMLTLQALARTHINALMDSPTQRGLGIHNPIGEIYSGISH